MRRLPAEQDFTKLLGLPLMAARRTRLHPSQRFRHASRCAALPGWPNATPTFLGDKVTRRRQGQFDAAMRRLEGCGAPEEQRSGGETDDTGVLEAEGEATGELSFSP